MWIEYHMTIGFDPEQRQLPFDTKGQAILNRIETALRNALNDVPVQIVLEIHCHHVSDEQAQESKLNPNRS